MLSPGENITSVSYTHLDVYKRQPLTRRERALIGVSGGLTGLFAALSLFSALAIMSFLLIFIPVIVALSGAILKPFVKKSKTI